MQFGFNRPSGLRGDVIWKKVDEAGADADADTDTETDATDGRRSLSIL